MTQQPRSQRIVAAAGAIENIFTQLEAVQATLNTLQATLNTQLEQLPEASADLRNVAQSLAIEGD